MVIVCPYLSVVTKSNKAFREVKMTTALSEEEENLHEMKETATMMSTLSVADLNPNAAKRTHPPSVRLTP